MKEISEKIRAMSPEKSFLIVEGLLTIELEKIAEKYGEEIAKTVRIFIKGTLTTITLMCALEGQSGSSLTVAFLEMAAKCAKGATPYEALTACRQKFGNEITHRVAGILEAISETILKWYPHNDEGTKVMTAYFAALGGWNDAIDEFTKPDSRRYP